MVVAGVVCGFGSNLRAALADGIQGIVHDSIVTYQQVEDHVAQALPREYRNRAQVDQRASAI